MEAYRTRHSTILDKRTIRKVISVFFWLLLWQLVSLAVNNSILLVGPYETLRTLIRDIATKDFLLSAGGTLLRVTAGFLSGCILGALLACLSYRSEAIRDLLAPLMSVIKSIPVASFVVLILIWAEAPFLSLIISLLVVLPVVYHNILEGLLHIDEGLLEMADVFRMRKRDRLKYVFLPGLKPFIEATVSVCAGMAWKSGIAAEVIGRPSGSLGGNIYLSKIYLETSELFAWTLVAVVMAALFEKLIKAAVRRALKWH